MTQVLVDNRRNAWKRGGTSVDASSAVDAARQAGLDWTVSIKPLVAEISPLVMSPSGVTPAVYESVPKRDAVVRNDTNAVIGVVGSKYKLVQNMEVFSALDVLIDSGQARYSAAGSYNGGANVWMLMELPDGITVANDPHAAYLLATTSHDGSSSVIVRPIIERVFCANQIGKILGNERKKALTYTMKHTTNAELSISEIRDITTLVYKNIEEYELTADKLLKRETDKYQARNIFRKVFALPPELEDAPYNMLSQGQRKQQTIAYEARDKVWDIYSESPTQENIRGTAFGVWQAVIEYADYYSRGTSDKRALDTITGKNDRIKNKALSILTA